MNIKDLKIGDRVKIKHIKFKEHDPDCSYAYIIKLSDENGFYKAIINGMEVTIHGDWFIALMQPITHVSEYKEIPIEKEKPTINFKKELEERLKLRIAGELSNEKSAPKSFKFDIRVTEFSSEIKQYGTQSINKISGYSVSHGTPIRFENIPAPEWLNFNKEYTIEIKEKE